MSQDTVVLNGEKVGDFLRLTDACLTVAVGQVCLFYIFKPSQQAGFTQNRTQDIAAMVWEHGHGDLE